MAHTEVPNSVLRNIEKLARRFLRHKDSNSKGMHYVSWRELCLPRDMGGLGFHDLIAWKGALRARLAWTVINDPDSLLHKVVTAKYGADPWENIRRTRCSATWKIIREGADALAGILRWKVGDGRRVRILQDCWILDRRIERWPTFVNVEAVDNAHVNHLLDDNFQWNADVVEHCFGTIMAQRILNIVTTPSAGADQPELIKSCFGSSLAAVVYRDKFGPANFEFGWMHKLKLHPREKFHWWRLLRDAIPTNMWLLRRGLSGTGDCSWGCGGEENTEHCITRCSKLREVLDILGKWGFVLPFFDTLEMALDGLAILAETNRNLGALYCYAVYHVWYCGVPEMN
ncbi:hypothetical protein KFK09_016579 [Dendrobium nobile]|uniref:Reverse transcriptase zinc-binding domain-containing protein n=1 Tax=Dendrobium nobile TaxID=94219 RepID=A0A8T3AZZ7_DENNO|nr:hypothetical protein KFK09_016579 [Dendrobium nobile]